MTHRIERGEDAREPHKIPVIPEVEKAMIGVQDITKGATFSIIPKEIRQMELLDWGVVQKLSCAAEEVDKKLEVYQGVARNLEPEKIQNLTTWSRQHRSELIKIARMRANAASDWGKFYESGMAVPGEIIENIEGYVAYPLEFFISPLADLGELGKDIVARIHYAEMAFKVPKLLGKGANLIYKRIILSQIREQLHEGKEDPQLEKWLSIQDELLKEEALSLGSETVAYIPLGIKTVAIALDKFTDVVAYGNLWVVSVAKLVINSYQVYKVHQDIKTYEEWMVLFNEKPMSSEAIHQLLDKRKKTLGEKMDKQAQEFNDWITPLILKTQDFSLIEETLGQKGIDLNKLSVSVTSRQDLLTLIAKKEKRDEILKQYVEHKQTFTVMARKAIQSLAETKGKIEKEFLDFKLKKFSISLAFSLLATIVLVTLKTLAIIGAIAIPTIALAYSGVGIFAFGIGLLMAGLFMFYKRKPHLFKAFFQGVNFRLAVYSIPFAFQEFRLKLQQIKQHQKILAVLDFQAQTEQLKGILKQSEVIEARAFPSSLAPLLKKLKVRTSEQLEDVKLIKKRLEEVSRAEFSRYEKDRRELAEKIEVLSRKVKYWEKKITPLKERLLQAGLQDFLRASRLAKDFSGHLDEVIAEGIFVDEDFLDEATRRILPEQLGIDLDRLRQEPDSGRAKEGVKKALRTFFAMDDSALIKSIRGMTA